MKLSGVFQCVGATLAALATVACFAAPHTGRVLQVGVPAPSLAGSLLPNPERQPLMVYLPAAYRREPERRFPVVYYLPGFTTDVTEYLDQRIQGFSLGIFMDDLVRLGRVAPMIVVVVNGRNAVGGGFYVDSPVTGGWESYVVRDVVGWMDRTYRTIGESAARGLAGDSMGGFGALHLAMRHPDVFGAVYALSPGLFADVGPTREWLFASPDAIDADLALLEELGGLPEAAARRRFLEAVDAMYGVREGGYRRAFAWAYGAAFAPAPDGAPPWVDYPFRRATAGTPVASVEPLRRYAAGFGALEDKVSTHREALAGLRGLVLDYGRNDDLRWIPEGCERLSALLKEAGVTHEVRAHDGGHDSWLRFRLERELLPFFSERLEGAVRDENVDERPVSLWPAAPPAPRPWPEYPATGGAP